MTETATTTGTIYGLVDPRDDGTKYIGQTVRPLPVRLSGFYNRNTAPKVRAWIAELREVGLKPVIVPIREGVPVAQLLAAEHEEITRIVATGGALLNESSTAEGRELNRQRRETERAAAERAAWKELAGAALAALGGPLPPGELPEVSIPETSWHFMSKIQPGHTERMHFLVRDDWQLGQELEREHEQASRELWSTANRAWGDACGLGGERFARRMERHVTTVAGTPCSSRADASRFLALIFWYVVAVDPWHHLAEIAGLAPDDAAFTAWAGRGAGVREALEFLAERREGILASLAGDWEGDRWHA